MSASSCVFLPTPSDPVQQRLRFLAAQRGLVLVPQSHSLVAVGGTQQETMSTRPSPADGPFVLTAWATAAAAMVSSGEWQFDLRTGARRLTDGTVLGLDLFDRLPTAIDGTRRQPAPVAVLPGDVLTVDVTAASGSTVVAGAALVAVGFSVRRRNGEMVSEEEGRAWAVDVLADGEWFAIGLQGTTKQTIGLSQPFWASRIAVGGIDGTTNTPTRLRVSLAHLQLSPLGFTGMCYLSEPLMVWEELTTFIRAGDRVVMEPEYAAGATAIEARVLMVGRRGRAE